MKKSQIFNLLLICSIVTACNNYDWDTDHNTTLTPIRLATGDFSVEMTVNYRDSATNAGNTYELAWEHVKAADYSTVFYEVLFYAADETQPFFIGTPEKIQIENRLLLTEKEINVLAENARIPQNTTGQIHWRLRASNGINEEFSDETRTITITRPDGFAAYPESLTAKSETTSTFRKNVQDTTFNGEYESYAFLSDGAFYLQDNSENPHYYAIADDGKLEEIYENPLTNAARQPISPNKIHRILLNFKNATASIHSIQSVELWYSGSNDTWGELIADEPDIPFWSITKQITLINYPTTAPDYRYKFLFNEKDRQGNLSKRFVGPQFPTVTNISSTTGATYFQLFNVDDSRSNYCFKLSRDHDGKTLKIDVDMRSNTTFFRHYVTEIK